MAISFSSSSVHRLSFLRHLRPFSSFSIVAVDPEVKRLAKARRFPEIETLLESKKKNRTSTSEPSFASIIVSYGYAKMLGHASRTFDQMPKLGCRTRTALSLNALLNSYNHTGNHSRVPGLFTGLCRKYSIEPDEVSYVILIKSLCELGTPEKAYQVLKEMDEKGMRTSVVVYTPILDALYKNNKPEEAGDLWNHMVTKGCVPDLAAYNVRVMYSAHNEKPEDVLKVFDEMESVGLRPDIISYNLLISCHCKNKRHLDAKNVYQRMKERNLSPNSATYRNFMYFLCKNGDFDAGFNVCREAVMRNKVPDIGPLKLLLQGLVKNSREKDARWLIQKLKRNFSGSLLKEWEKVEEQIGLGLF